MLILFLALIALISVEFAVVMGHGTSLKMLCQLLIINNLSAHLITNEGNSLKCGSLLTKVIKVHVDGTVSEVQWVHYSLSTVPSTTAVHTICK